MRLSLLLAVAALACSSNDQPRRSATAFAPTPVAGERPEGATALSAELVRSYFAEGPAAEASARFGLEDWKTARDGFAAALAAAEGEDRVRLGLMIGLADAELGRWKAAASALSDAADALAVIADWVRYQAARAHYFAGDHETALTEARKVSPESIAGADAELLVGDILRGRSEWQAIADHYRDYLDRRPGGIRIAEARYRLAEAHEALGRGAADALPIYHRLSIETPLSRWGRDAGARVKALLGQVPQAERARFTQLTAADYITRGMVYFQNMRNEESEADFAAALSAPGLDADQACVAAYHRAQSVWRQRDRPRAAPHFDEAMARCRKTDNIDLQVRSTYQAGRCYGNKGLREKAIERFAAIEARYPKHSYADDARLRQAEQQSYLGNEDKVTELLSRVPELYPDGDMRAEAMWRLGWRAFKEGDHEEAIGWFRKQIETVPIDTNWWGEGQPQYWMGRAYAELGKTAESIAAYQSAVRTYPLSYYALLALNRLRESHPKAFEALVAEIQATPEGAGSGGLTFSPREVFTQPGFERALEFLRLGLGRPAEIELARLGLRAPDGRDEVTDPDEQEKLWAMAFLYDAAGRYDRSHWVTRYHLTGYKRRWPAGEHRTVWRLAYPLGYHELLSRHAKQHGYEPELLLAFVREESAFNPLLESFANAIGLTQMIFPTARRFAKGTGIDVSRETLRDPEKNVTIGSRFLAFLMKEWDGRIALVVPSYNAGEGSTRRWLRARGDWAQDAWGEEIPFDETRGYSKRVIATYFAYSYLRDGTIPVIPNDIPRRLLPK